MKSMYSSRGLLGRFWLKIQKIDLETVNYYFHLFLIHLSLFYFIFILLNNFFIKGELVDQIFREKKLEKNKGGR